MATIKVTKKDNFNALRAIVEATDVANKSTLLDFIDNELELLAKKANSAKSKPSKAQAENDTIKTLILAALAKSDTALTITEFQTKFEIFAEYSNQKMSALFKQLVDSGMVEKTVVKKKSYFAISATGAEIVEKANSSAKENDTTDGE